MRQCLSRVYTPSHSTSHTPLLTLTANDTRWAGLVNLAICVDSLKISDAARRVSVGGGREGWGVGGAFV